MRKNKSVVNYLNSPGIQPLFLCGDSLELLKSFPKNSIDCVITSPPYFHKKHYAAGGIGFENSWQEYVDNILAVTIEVKRILKPSGSFWLNIGDSYLNKQLLNLPNRIAIKMQDDQKWILRNTVVWNKCKPAMPVSGDCLRSQYEPLFHFVKRKTGYYYNSDNFRKTSGSSSIINGKPVSSSGVNGERYRKMIALNSSLTLEQKQNANMALDDMLNRISSGELSDFRMVIKGSGQRVSQISNGRSKELDAKGFYFIRCNPKGSFLSDIWNVKPDQYKGSVPKELVSFPEKLVRTPILLTCPPDGTVLDPFAGIGTTNYVSKSLNRKSIGIDIASEYLEKALNRCK